MSSRGNIPYMVISGTQLWPSITKSFILSFMDATWMDVKLNSQCLIFYYAVKKNKRTIQSNSALFYTLRALYLLHIYDLTTQVQGEHANLTYKGVRQGWNKAPSC